MKKKPKIITAPGKKACVNPYLIHLLYLSWTFIARHSRNQKTPLFPPFARGETGGCKKNLQKKEVFTK